MSQAYGTVVRAGSLGFYIDCPQLRLLGFEDLYFRPPRKGESSDTESDDETRHKRQLLGAKMSEFKEGMLVRFNLSWSYESSGRKGLRVAAKNVKRCSHAQSVDSSFFSKAHFESTLQNLAEIVKVCANERNEIKNSLKKRKREDSNSPVVLQESLQEFNSLWENEIEVEMPSASLADESYKSSALDSEVNWAITTNDSSNVATQIVTVGELEDDYAFQQALVGNYCNTLGDQGPASIMNTYWPPQDWGMPQEEVAIAVQDISATSGFICAEASEFSPLEDVEYDNVILSADALEFSSLENYDAKGELRAEAPEFSPLEVHDEQTKSHAEASEIYAVEDHDTHPKLRAVALEFSSLENYDAKTTLHNEATEFSAVEDEQSDNTNMVAAETSDSHDKERNYLSMLMNLEGPTFDSEESESEAEISKFEEKKNIIIEGGSGLSAKETPQDLDPEEKAKKLRLARKQEAKKARAREKFDAEACRGFREQAKKTLNQRLLQRQLEIQNSQPSKELLAQQREYDEFARRREEKLNTYTGMDWDDM